MQGFASSSTLDIVVDLVTIVFMLGLMFWLDWDFTLIAVGVTPFLLVFVLRFKKAVKEVTRERAQAAERGRRRGPGGTGLGAGGQGLRPAGPRGGPNDGGEPRHRRGGAQGAQGEVVALAGGEHRGGGLHRLSCCGRAPP